MFPWTTPSSRRHPLQRLVSLRGYSQRRKTTARLPVAQLDGYRLATPQLRNSRATKSPEVSCCESFEYPRNFVPKL